MSQTTKKSSAQRSSAETATAKKGAPERGTGSFTAQEKAAMKERAAEARAEKRSGSGRKKAAEDAAACEAKIAEMPDADRVLCEQLHAVITSTAPELAPRLYYGMPAYAKDGKVLCFVQPAEKFGTRYATLGFQDVAALDDGTLWPTAWAVTTLKAADAKTVAALVKRAVG